MLALANTNPGESTEFMNTKGWLTLLPLLAVVVLIVLSLRRMKSTPLTKTGRLTLILLFLGSVIFLGENALHDRLIRKGSPHLIKTAVAFSTTIDGYRAAMNNAVPRDVKILERDSLPRTLVLIIGESLNRNHMSLYGAERETSPLLSCRDDIQVYQNVISGYSNTVSSVLNSLSETNTESADTASPKVDIIDILHAADYKTYWLSNQPPIGIWENIVSYLANKTDNPVYVNTSSSSSFEATYTVSYDDKLLKPLRTALDAPGERKLIVLHLMGNHTSYSKRYPPAYKKWEESGEVPGTRAHYANAVLYNDYVVDSIFSMLTQHAASSDQENIALYLSDHGENVYDENGNCGHDYAGTLPKSNVEIPFILWQSNTSKARTTALSTPYMSDDLFHTIQDLAKVKNSYYTPTRAFFHTGYDSTRVRKMERYMSRCFDWLLWYIWQSEKQTL